MFWLSSFLSSELSKTDFGNFLTLMVNKLLHYCKQAQRNGLILLAQEILFSVAVPHTCFYQRLIPLTCLGRKSSTSAAGLHLWLLADQKFYLCLILVTFYMHCNLSVCFSTRKGLIKLKNIAHFGMKRYILWLPVYLVKGSVPSLLSFSSSDCKAA